MSVARTFCLTVHARYRCAHSGACCTAGWSIPIEDGVRRAVEAMGIRGRSGIHELFVTHTDGVVAATAPDGGCVFFEPERGRLCAIHRVGGESLLPSACRHFPRVVLRDPRGVFVTLSHFCPTAAAMLLEPVDLAVIEAPPSLALDGELEGLDATAVMPPLLCRDVLTDLEGYDAWERSGIAVLNRCDLTPTAALDLLARATDDVCAWRPGREPLSSRVARAFAAAPGPARRGLPQRSTGEDRARRAFLAAHLFGNWIAYENGGLPAVVQYLRGCLALLDSERKAHSTFVEAVRAADRQIRHRRWPNALA